MAKDGRTAPFRIVASSGRCLSCRGYQADDRTLVLRELNKDGDVDKQLWTAQKISETKAVRLRPM